MIKKLFILLCLCCIGIGNVWGEEGDLLCGGSFIGALPEEKNGLWTGSDVDFYSGNGYKLDTDETLQSPNLVAGVKKVTIKILVGHNGGATSTLKVGAYNSSDELLAESKNIVPTVAYTAQTDDAIQEFTLDGGTTDIKYVKLSFTKVKNYGMKKLEVYNATSTPSKTLESIAVSGTPTKTTYKEGEPFDPAGLVVTGTYDDESQETITSGITWYVTPNGALTAGTTSVSVTAKVGDITSSAYQVTGLTVTEYVQTYANTYTSNVTLTADGGTSASTAKVKWEEHEYDAIKAGTGKAAGACVVTIPANTKTLHFHVAGWNGESVTLDVNGTEYTLNSDAGVNSNTPFTLQNDPETNDYFTLDPQGATTITFTATSGNRFVLFGVNAERTQDVTIAGTGYSSFSSTYAVTIPTGITAYYATGVDGNKVTMTEVEGGVIPANEGVIIKGDASTEYTFTETVSNKSFYNNKLVAVSERIEGLLPEVTIAEVTYKNYVFTQGQFHPFTTGATVNVGAGKAYLRIVKPADPSAKLEMNFDGSTTGIDAIHSIQVNDNAIYNLRGERVNTMSKGNIYIVNGKKYLFK